MNAGLLECSTATIKTITLIRHGVAYHNVHDAQTGARPNYLNPELTDPSLILQGETQARVLGEQLRRKGVIILHPGESSLFGISSVSVATRGGSGGVDASLNGGGMDVDVGAHDNIGVGGSNPPSHAIELVVCSPLMRCLQTASLIFPSYFANSNLSSAESCGLSALESGNEVYILDSNCSLFCHGDLREAYGIHYPDKRGPLSRLKSAFPSVHYHPALTEDDNDWRPDARETREYVSRRIHNFFVWLMQQPHSNVAIVTHGVWMECALLNYCPEALEFGNKRVFNCDVYSGTLMRSLEQNGVVLRDVEKVHLT